MVFLVETIKIIYNEYAQDLEMLQGKKLKKQVQKVPTIHNVPLCIMENSKIKFIIKKFIYSKKYTKKNKKGVF
jgi:hypothetical protein